MKNESDKIPEVAIWALFAEEVGGVYTESPLSSPSVMHIAVPGTVVFAIEGREVLLDTIVMPGSNNTSHRTTTRFRALVHNSAGFRFKIYRELDTAFGGALKFMRLLKDVEIGHPEFDKQFIMRGTDEDKVKRFFSDPDYQALLELLPSHAVLHILDDDTNIFKRKLPKEVDILTLSLHGGSYDIEALRAMKNLFEGTLRRLAGLQEIGPYQPEGSLPE